jgi:hypothetical protein
MTSAAELKRLIGQRKAITVPGTANALFARVIQDLGCPFPVLDTPANPVFTELDEAEQRKR